MNRILYFVHYNKYNLLSEHVIYLLKNVRILYTRVVVISNSPLSGEQQNKLADLCDEILVRENKGFDFGAWKDAILKDGWDKLSQYDNLTLMNDTCFGPLFDLEKIYLDMEQKDIDFWGLTNHRNERSGMPKTNKPIPEHIQSYFVCFKKQVVDSCAFITFWKNIRYKKRIENVIQSYETRFTKILIKAGFKYAVFLDKNGFPEIKYALSLSRPDLCLKYKVPFLKVKAFLVFLCQKNIITQIQKNTNYPVSIIFDYLNQIYDPDKTLFIQNKLILNGEKNGSIPPSQQSTKAAIHIHSYYPDILDKFILFLNSTNVNFDLYITTDSPEKKDIIYTYLKNQVCFSKLKEIIITENQGRDIVPWLSIKDRLNQYAIVGHFHTKRTLHTEEWVGISWLDDILDSLLNNINNIINEFHNNTNLGIVIPEVPFIFRKFGLPDFVNLNKISSNLWKRLKCRKEIDFGTIKNIIFPMGTMFWYRPAALKPLFELQLLPDDIPQEPLPEETILHSIERLFVYIAWNEDYDYRISLPSRIRNSNFVDMHRDYDAITVLTNSRAYRIGRLILTVPRVIKSLAKIVSMKTR
jgi:rhamnosyltransferase